MKKEEYEEYKNKNGNPLISDIGVSFDLSDIAYVIYSNKRRSVMELFKKDEDINDIVFLSHKQVKEDIIGMYHSKMTE